MSVTQLRDSYADLTPSLYYIAVHEFGEEPPSDPGAKFRAKPVLQEIANLLAAGGDERAFEVTFLDRDLWDQEEESASNAKRPPEAKGCWALFNEKITLEDLATPARFRLRYTSSKKPFSSAAFLSEKGFKKFKKVNGEDFKLRIPQEEALLKLRKVLAPASPSSRFMVILPTGLGKTAVMALAPFMLEASRVLVILPNLTIKSQVHQQLAQYYSHKHAIGRTGDVKVIVQQYDGKQLKSAPDVLTTNVQALVDVARAAENGAQDEGLKKENSLKEAALLLLNDLKPDLVMIDEGHHFPASSWELISQAAFEANFACKFILMTATPQRGDGASYGLVKVDRQGEEFYYLYSRADAISRKYIKSVQYHPIVPIFQKPRKLERYEEEAYIIQMLDPAVKMLLGLRFSCARKPMRMLVNARTNDSADKLAKFFNERSSQQAWGLRAVAITGKTKNNNPCWQANFECDAEHVQQPGKMIDVVVQNQMLGEGYDNPWIAVSVFVRPAKSVGYLSQTHGRAIRRTRLDANEFPRAMESHLFYPDEEDPRTMRHDVRNVMEQYENCEDESTASLFAVTYKTLKAAHTKLGEMSTADCVGELRSNFNEYHEKYAEKREGAGEDERGWTPIPAEQVAADLYDSFIGDRGDICQFRIIDFGCGFDGLFEARLAERLKRRDASGKVLALALDVVAFRDAQSLTTAGATPEGGIDAAHTEFACMALACDYTEVKSHPDFKEYGEVKFDAGIFCLSLMASDALERGLLVASQTVKPAGVIYIVIDPWKLGINPRWDRTRTSSALHEWCDTFYSQTGFATTAAEFKGTPSFAYVQLTNVGLNEVDSLRSKLAGLTFKSLLQPMPSSLTKDQAVPSGMNENEASESKRHLSFPSDGRSNGKAPRTG